MKTSLEVQPDDMMRGHWDGENNPLERPQASKEEDEVVADSTSHADQGVIFKLKLGRTSKHHKSPLVISNRRCLGNNKGRHQEAQIGGETTLFKQTSRETRKQQQQHESPPAGRLLSADNSEG